MENMIEYSENGIPDDCFNNMLDYIKNEMNYYFDIDQNAELEFKKEINDCLKVINFFIPNYTVDDFLNNSNNINIINNVYQDYLQCMDEYKDFTSMLEDF